MIVADIHLQGAVVPTGPQNKNAAARGAGGACRPTGAGNGVGLSFAATNVRNARIRIMDARRRAVMEIRTKLEACTSNTACQLCPQLRV